MRLCGSIILLLCHLCLLHTVQAQTRLEGTFEGTDLIVQAHNGQGNEDELIFQAVWRNVPGAYADFQLQRTMAVTAGTRLMADELLEAAFGTYLDSRIHFSKQGVTADLPAARMAMEMNALLFAAVEGLGLNVELAGLTEATRQQLERLVKIDWSQAKLGVDGGSGQDKYLAIYYYVRSQREELERQIRADLLPLAGLEVLEEEALPVGRSVRIASTCGTVYDDENYLCALDLQLADTGGGVTEPELGMQIAGAIEQAKMEEEEQVPLRPRDRWLKRELDRMNERIERMDQRKELWELRDRLDDIEDRLTGLELEVRHRPADVGAPDDNPLADLSHLTGQNITIRFQRNSTEVGPEYQVLLNEVFEQLARSPQDRVLITGYTDRSGDPAVNLKLSEQRAKAVRNYLLRRGIAAERLMVNYYGDSRSTMRDPSQRRVEIEWLQERKERPAPGGRSGSGPIGRSHPGTASDRS